MGRWRRLWSWLSSVDRRQLVETWPCPECGEPVDVPSYPRLPGEYLPPTEAERRAACSRHTRSS